MLKPHGMIRNTFESQQEQTLPPEFGLLCWNVHKRNIGYKFDLYFNELLERYDIDLLALQEVKINQKDVSLFETFHYSFAPNIKLLHHSYGVLNGSRILDKETYSLLSSHRESMIRTHKSAIFSTYALHTGELLLLVNLHAINFRATKIYNKEIETIFEKIVHHRGPMIVTGDFNCWNRQRITLLMKLAGSLHLKNCEIGHGHLIKSFMNYKLDHIFYRGVQLIESCAVDVQRISDHNALYARFKAL
ncbi:MAG: endonuclease/exonuclease/phosphatase family protein [Sulfuricurvum sp.]|uniref:endonuclease/exonuclease/phosphatase family protein n=1 Tax=Sulfuricurvum sp. TaxID=2025608 RepID=UPI00261ACF26|nr:endonuclease/exonuclease/phosphatase family protein [Sulfuricurvum sp.]MDD2369573.1 endonuclease/exonuclease/phosphatase family protein [Sulfuricurvum sp.]MDD2949323.1 endonuclease/exonuclease/phosphatase family protein [Sulfuricurvum sp.]MDD5119091.1 endonuclease/exonuclease/phosphatase family protein [Sulfuricurvum sp.]